MAGILYASGLSLSRCHGEQPVLVRREALAAVAAIVRLGGAGVNGGRLGDELVQSDPELERCHKIADHHRCLSR